MTEPQTDEKVELSENGDEVALNEMLVPNDEEPEKGEDETQNKAKYHIVKQPHSVPDPMIKGKRFILDGWAYHVYDGRSRGRKFVQREGKVILITDDE